MILREHLYIFALLDYRRENTSNMFRIITKFQFHVYSLASEIEIPIEYTRNTNFRDRYLYIYIYIYICYYDERQDCGRDEHGYPYIYETEYSGAPINKFHEL